MYTTISYSQISPGKLTQAHADLEGMSKCTQCHDLGNKVTNTKCLDCHDDIQNLIDNKQGYHANSDVLKKDCFECHGEHFGRKFDMLRFDQDKFNHDLTGYELEGKHAVVDCRECHVSENIQDLEIKKRRNTFLGLDEKCLSCHDDFHQETLSNDCVQCHDMEAFDPASKFDHKDAEFQLLGEHIEVDCIECHETTTRNGKEFQEFTGLAFEDCKSCHDDPHENRIEGACIQCHTENSFSTFTGQGKFNHSLTDFTLKGKHKQVNCFECHQQSSNPLMVFNDKQKTTDVNNCVACHEDQHDGKFGTDCVKCHKETSFLSLKPMDFFDHSVTDYPLEGKHVKVDCKQCHTERFSIPIDFTACNSCHEDYHEGEFTLDNFTPDCVNCHSLEKGFDYSFYTVEQHQETKFPLEGAHIATPCYACHVSEDDERWTFSNLGSTCVDCHTDTHDGFISEKFYPEKDCKSCHVSETWSSVSFDHDQTEWPLEGQHATVQCSACHYEMSGKNEIVKQTFKGLAQDCVACHENKHGDEFAIDGVTDCKRCHVTESWYPEIFDHNTTEFALTGQHVDLKCKQCHSIETESGEITITYKLGKFECIDCHQ